jgi:cyclopropane fatty-acyl-phospholipid synthase-like methyltransferase
MKSYWQSYFDEKSNKSKGSLLKQVGKTVDGKEVGDDQVQLIVENITEKLGLTSKDDVVDLCCGNGLITKFIAKHVHSIIGVDFSEGLIRNAKEHCSGTNIQYIHSDILKLNKSWFSDVNSIYMSESLQHLTPDMFNALLNNMNEIGSGALFFVGGIPDISKLREFYNTEDKFSYHLKCEKESRPHIGHWWDKNELKRIARKCNYKAIFYSQDERLNTAYYRFDVLLEKI